MTEGARADMKWGLLGYEGKSLLINTRVESVLEKRKDYFCKAYMKIYGFSLTALHEIGII